MGLLGAHGEHGKINFIHPIDGLEVADCTQLKMRARGHDWLTHDKDGNLKLLKAPILPVKKGGGRGVPCSLPTFLPAKPRHVIPMRHVYRRPLLTFEMRVQPPHGRLDRPGPAYLKP